MSHFSVTVIGPDADSQLAPYQENNMCDCPRQYLKFNDEEDKYRKEYEEDGVEMVVMENGELAYTWDDRFKVGTNIFDQKTEVPANLVKREVPHRERYATFEAFMNDWAGFKERDEETGRYGYWENPNAKWDYYRLGGRWRGQFRLKPEFAGKYGIPEKSWEWTFDKDSLDASREKDNGLYVDQALKGEIDWDTMRAEAGERAGKNYDLAMSILKDLPVNRCWEEVRDEENDREVYWTQPRCVAWKEAQERIGLKDWPFGWDGSPDNFLVSREVYVETEMNGAVTTFALVKDSKWYERGSMGWWGCVSEEKDQQTWNSMYWNLLKELPDDTLLSCYDCHI